MGTPTGGPPMETHPVGTPSGTPLGNTPFWEPQGDPLQDHLGGPPSITPRGNPTLGTPLRFRPCRTVPGVPLCEPPCGTPVGDHPWWTHLGNTPWDRPLGTTQIVPHGWNPTGGTTPGVPHRGTHQGTPGATLGTPLLTLQVTPGGNTPWEPPLRDSPLGTNLVIPPGAPMEEPPWGTPTGPPLV